MLPSQVYSLAETQHAVIARFQLLRWMRDDQIAHRVGPGRELHRLERGCYLVRGTAVRPEHPAFAAALRARPGATITGPVVLGLIGIDGFADSSIFEILTSPGRRVRGVRFPHRIDPDPRRPFTQYGEVRAVGPLDALIDSARYLEAIGERRLRAAYDRLRWSGLIDADRLRGRVEQLDDPRGGGRALLGLLELDGLAPESDGERSLGRILRVFSPEPEPQVWITPTRRVDWFYRSVRFAYEYLGRVDHEGIANRIADDARNEELRDQGIRIGYVTAADLRDPTALTATVAGRLVVRALELGVPAPILGSHHR